MSHRASILALMLVACGPEDPKARRFIVDAAAYGLACAAMEANIEGASEDVHEAVRDALVRDHEGQSVDRATPPVAFELKLGGDGEFRVSGKSSGHPFVADGSWSESGDGVRLEFLRWNDATAAKPFVLEVEQMGRFLVFDLMVRGFRQDGGWEIELYFCPIPFAQVAESR